MKKIILCVIFLCGLGINIYPLGQTNSPEVTTLPTSPLQAEAGDFVSTWDTREVSTGSSASNQIQLPLISSGIYDFVVDWGDGESDTITIYNQAEITHTYALEGRYTLIIAGTIMGWQFDSGKDRLKLFEISQWGALGLGTCAYHFTGCENLNLTAIDAPDLSQTFSLRSSFQYCYSLGSAGSMDLWDVSNVYDISYMFKNATTFNQPIGSWDTSAVEEMKGIFTYATDFNQPIDGWDVSHVEEMMYVFQGAWKFNQPLGSWDVSAVTRFRFAFYEAYEFNQPIGTWDVSRATEMVAMFSGATAFNQSLNDWDVSNVEEMERMFHNAIVFNGSIGQWNVSHVTSMVGMFIEARSFNQPLGSWDVSNVVYMNWMFINATAFNQPLSTWDVSKVKYMTCMFENATAFDQFLGDWNPQEAIDMREMFEGAGLSVENYDNLLSGWSQKNLKSGLTFHAGNSKYSVVGLPGRNILTETLGWTIEDQGFIPPPPANISVIFGEQVVLLTWNIMEDLWNAVEKYDVYRSSQSGGEFTFIGESLIPFFADATVVAGNTYYYKFKTVTENETSKLSEEVPVVVCTPSGDADGDGLTDIDEVSLYGTDPSQVDSDGDYFLDGYEIARGSDPNDNASWPGLPEAWFSALNVILQDNITIIQTLGSNITEIRTILNELGYIIGDTDYDGLDDLDELLHNTSITCADTDCDNLNDAFEVKMGTDPLNDDSDGDSWMDGVEAAAGTNPLDAADYPGSDSLDDDSSDDTSDDDSGIADDDPWFSPVIMIGGGIGIVGLVGGGLLVVLLRKK